MLKITITVQDKKGDSDDCTVKIQMPKDIEKASKSEKNVGSTVYQVITRTLEDLEHGKIK